MFTGLVAHWDALYIRCGYNATYTETMGQKGYDSTDVSLSCGSNYEISPTTLGNCYAMSIVGTTKHHGNPTGDSGETGGSEYDADRKSVV